MKIDGEKTRYWTERFNDYRANPESLGFPKRITIEPTNDCNLACAMCPRKKTDAPTGYMDFDVYTRIIDEISAHSTTIPIVLFFRGESLLHDRFDNMLDYASLKGFTDISLATNATLLGEEYTKTLLDSNLSFISFSIDAASEDHYRSQRIGADYETVTTNIERFLDEKNKRGDSGPTTQVSLVETSETAAEIDDFVALWQPQVDRVRIYKEHSRLSGFGSGVENANETAFPARLPCPKVIWDVVIYWNGDVALCNHDWDRKDTIGNVTSESIENIWTSNNYKDIRHKHIKGNLDDQTPCNHCDYWKTFYLAPGMFGRLYENKANKQTGNAMNDFDKHTL